MNKIRDLKESAGIKRNKSCNPIVRHYSLKRLLQKNLSHYLPKSRGSVVNSHPHHRSDFILKEISNPKALMLKSFTNDISSIKNQPIENSVFKKKVENIGTDIQKCFDSHIEKALKRKQKRIRVIYDPASSYIKKNVIAEYNRYKRLVSKA